MIDSETNEILLDPTTEELARSKSTHVFVFDNKTSIASSDNKDQDQEKDQDSLDGAILYSDSTGIFTEKEYFECAHVGFKAAQAVHGFIRTAVQKKLEKEYQQTQA